jgi:hypothetical protein
MQSFNILQNFSKNSKMSDFMNIRLIGAAVFNANGQTDMTKIIAAFINFENTPKSAELSLVICQFLVWSSVAPVIPYSHIIS